MFGSVKSISINIYINLEQDLEQENRKEICDFFFLNYASLILETKLVDNLI